MLLSLSQFLCDVPGESMGLHVEVMGRWGCQIFQGFSVMYFCLYAFCITSYFELILLSLKLQWNCIPICTFWSTYTTYFLYMFFFLGSHLGTITLLYALQKFPERRTFQMWKWEAMACSSYASIGIFPTWFFWLFYWSCYWQTNTSSEEYH